MDTHWIRAAIVKRFGSLDSFAALMRAAGQTVITPEALAAALDGRGDLWGEEAVVLADLLSVPLLDVLASLCLARIDHRFALPHEDQRYELAN